MKAADLSYVSPTGQETQLTDEQLVDAAANTPPVGATTQQSTASAQTQPHACTGRDDGPGPAASDEHSDGGNWPAGLISLLGGAWLRFRA